ncbi:MAG: hypothetical protein IAE65_08345 [Ignavibacteria bacterium]|nr:hypothetical protein [Ignavibacteria bacterium]
MTKIKKIAQQLINENVAKKDLATAFIWYHYFSNQKELSLSEANNCFVDCDLPKYNLTYLKKDLRLSKNVTKGSLPNTYKPVGKYSQEMTEKFPFVGKKSEDVLTDDTILPESLMTQTRGYIESLSKQINASYNHNVFDGCAVLMRRLLEILLIHSYEAVNLESQITENGGFRNLSFIINHTYSTKPFKLSKDCLEVLDSFRQMGNFSAHRIQFNAKRKDIDNVKLQYRVTIEELLYTSKIKK